MRSKLTLLFLFFSTVAIIAITFFNLSNESSSFKGFLNANSANQKKTNKLVSELGHSNTGSLRSGKKVHDLESRRLQDTTTTDTTTNPTENPSEGTDPFISTPETPENTDNGASVDGNTNNSTTPEKETSPLYRLNPTQVKNSRLVSGALNEGISKVIDIAVMQKNLPPWPLDYNWTRLISTTYRRYSTHSVYMFKTRLANSNLKRINANFTVYYNYTTKGYSLIWYSYHSFNYTKAELYADYPELAYNSTDNSSEDPNTSSGRTKITLEEINNDPQVLNAMLYGINKLRSVAAIHKEVADDANELALKNLTAARYLNQTTGVRYWFYGYLLEHQGDHSMEANFTVTYTFDTQKYRLAEYSYIVRNESIIINPNDTSHEGNVEDDSGSENPIPEDPSGGSETPDIDNGTGTDPTDPTGETPTVPTNPTDPNTTPNPSENNSGETPVDTTNPTDGSNPNPSENDSGSNTNDPSGTDNGSSSPETNNGETSTDNSNSNDGSSPSTSETDNGTNNNNDPSTTPSETDNGNTSSETDSSSTVTDPNTTGNPIDNTSITPSTDNSANPTDNGASSTTETENPSPVVENNGSTPTTEGNTSTETTPTEAGNDAGSNPSEPINTSEPNNEASSTGNESSFSTSETPSTTESATNGSENNDNGSTVDTSSTDNGANGTGNEEPANVSTENIDNGVVNGAVDGSIVVDETVNNNNN